MKTEYISDEHMSNISMTISSNNKRKHEDDATSSKRQRRVPDIVAFCEKHNIEWMPIKLDIVPKQNEDGTLVMENGEPKRVKILLPDRFGMPKQTDFAQDPQKVKQRHAAYHQNSGNYTHVAMDTREVFQIDIDCPDYADVFTNLMDGNEAGQKFPYTKSSTKSYGRHIFVRSSDFRPPKNRLQFKQVMPHPNKDEDVVLGEAIELLCGQWSWCPLNATVYNAEAEFDLRPGLSDLLEVKGGTVVTEKLDETYDLPAIFEAALEQGKASGMFSTNSRLYGSAWSQLVQLKSGAREQWSIRVQRPGNETCPNGHLHHSNRNSFMNVFKNEDGFENTVTVRCCNDKVYDLFKSGIVTKCKGLSKRIIVRNDPVETAPNASVFPAVPDILPENLFVGTDDCFAKAYMVHFGHDYIYSNEQLYHFNGDIWEDTEVAIYKDIGDLYNILEKKAHDDSGHAKGATLAEDASIDEEKKFKARKDMCEKMLNQILRLQQVPHKKRVSEDFKMLCKRYRQSDIQMDINDESREVVHFKDVCVRLRTGVIRKRVKTDFVTKCLNYNYREMNPKLNTLKDNLEKLLRMIQPDSEQYELMMDWLGYCLTGHTKEKKFMTLLGYTAANAKSTLIEIMKKCFPIYVLEIGNDAFDKDNSSWQKSFTPLLTNAYRIVYMEEFGEKSIDKQRLKRFVDGKEIALRVIYVKSEMAATLHAKLMANTNRDPNITCATNGIFRRAVGQYYTSKFVDDGTEDPSKHIYKADKELIDKFDDDDWKLAWFHLLLPRAMKYCQHGLTIPKKNMQIMRAAVEDYDEFSDLFEQYKVTKDNKDMVSKVEIMSFCESQESLRGNGWRWVLRALKQKGVMYKSQERQTIDGRTVKGFCTGIQLRKESDA
jgi:phage/plasmid-associated DNA primase